MRTGRPFVTWKFAATLDGRVAAADGTAAGSPRPASRADVHALRASVDAIVVGSGTVLADDPQLTVRDGDGTPAEQQPLRVVLDRRHRVAAGRAGARRRRRDRWCSTPRCRAFALKALLDRGVRHVLLEGGPTLAGAFVEARCVDEVVAYLAPKLLGAGRPPWATRASEPSPRRSHWTSTTVTRLGGRRQDRRPAASGPSRGGVAEVFTGIVEEVGEVVGLEPRGDAAVLTVARRRIADDAGHGDSIAVNGVCLTVVGWTGDDAACTSTST